MRPFQDLLVWQRAHALTLFVWRITREYPDHEQWTLMSQTRRSALSIPANLAEGCGLTTLPQIHRHVVIAAGSASELEYHLLLASELGYLPAAAYAEAQERLAEVRRLLAGFARWSRR